MDEILMTYNLDKSLDVFLDNITNNKVENIDCNFVEFIIEKSPSHIKYLDVYYAYFNKHDINIIKNTTNSHGVKLVDYYRNIYKDILDESIKKHIEVFLQSYEMSNNIMHLFIDDYIEETVLEHSLDDEILKMREDISNLKKDMDIILKIKDDINLLKNDIDNIKKVLKKKNKYKKEHINVL